MAISTTRIRSLTLSGGGKVYDLASFSCGWAIDAVPTATCSVITGLGILPASSGDRAWEDPDPATRWTVAVDVDGTSTELLSGYILGVSEETRANAGGSGVSLVVQLAADAARLQAVNSSTYVYWDWQGQDTMETKKQMEQFLVSKNNVLAGDVATLFTGDKKVQQVIEKLTGMSGFDDTYPRQKFLLGVATYFHAAVSYSVDQLNPLEYFIVDRDIELSLASGMPADWTGKLSKRYGPQMAQAYFKRWQGSSLWDTLVGTAQMFYLSLVPRRQKIEIVPVLGWTKTAHLTIGRSLVLGVTSGSQRQGLLYPPDRVQAIGRLPLWKNELEGAEKAPGIVWGIYPEPDQDAPPLKGRAATAMIPDWLGPSLLSEAGSTALAAGSGARLKEQEKPEETAAKGNEMDAAMPVTAQEFAKLYFARYQNAGRTLGLTVPWNTFSLIDALGYVVKVPDLASFAEREFHTVYGLLRAVNLSISRTAKGGSAAMALQLDQVRDESANAKFALDKHPFYSFDFQKGADQVAVGAGIKSNRELNLGSRLGPA